MPILLKSLGGKNVNHFWTTDKYKFYFFIIDVEIKRMEDHKVKLHLEKYKVHLICIKGDNRPDKCSVLLPGWGCILMPGNWVIGTSQSHWLYKEAEGMRPYGQLVHMPISRQSTYRNW